MLFSFTKNSPKCLINASPISCLKTEFSSIFCFSSFFTYLFAQSLQIHSFQKDLEAFPVTKDEGVKVIYFYNNNAFTYKYDVDGSSLSFLGVSLCASVCL